VRALFSALLLAACGREVQLSIAPDTTCNGRDLSCLSFVQLAQLGAGGATARCSAVAQAARSFDQLDLRGAVSVSRRDSADAVQVLGFGPSPAGPCTGPLLFAAGGPLPSSGATVLRAACHIDCSQNGPGSSGAARTFLTDPIDGTALVEVGELYQAKALVPLANPEVRFAPFSKQSALDVNAAFSSGPLLLVPPSQGPWCPAVRLRRDGVPPVVSCIDQGASATAFTIGREDIASVRARLKIDTGFILGRVIDDALGVPLAGAQLTPMPGIQVVYFAAGGLSGNPDPVTDDSGLFAVLYSDVLHLRATAPAFAARTIVAGTQADGIGLVEIALRR
jgi:hypothetical protein